MLQYAAPYHTVRKVIFELYDMDSNWNADACASTKANFKHTSGAKIEHVIGTNFDHTISNFDRTLGTNFEHVRTCGAIGP